MISSEWVDFASNALRLGLELWECVRETLTGNVSN